MTSYTTPQTSSLPPTPMPTGNTTTLKKQKKTTPITPTMESGLLSGTSATNQQPTDTLQAQADMERQSMANQQTLLDEQQQQAEIARKKQMRLSGKEKFLGATAQNQAVGGVAMNQSMLANQQQLRNTLYNTNSIFR